ncbi:MAG: dihydropteroate synthase [Acidimicrobiales bacterium]
MTEPARSVEALVVRGRTVDLSRPVLMGIVNATPDSFSDGGEHPDTAARVARAVEVVEQGATIVDVGGQSGITGVPEVPAGDEIARVVPVVEGIRVSCPDVVISVDTYKPPVVEAVLAAGADIVNDVSGLLYPEVATLCADAGAGLVIMHNRSRPKQRLTDPLLYDDVTDDVVWFLTDKLDEAERHGMARGTMIVDPGPDFAKTPHQTVEVLRRLDDVRELGRPVLLALSRKDFIGAITERSPRQRLGGTLAAVGHLAGPGTILRVHDVAAVADYLAVAAVLSGEARVAPDTQLAPELRREPPPQTTR